MKKHARLLIGLLILVPNLIGGTVWASGGQDDSSSRTDGDEEFMVD